MNALAVLSSTNGTLTNSIGTISFVGYINDDNDRSRVQQCSNLDNCLRVFAESLVARMIFVRFIDVNQYVDCFDQLRTIATGVNFDCHLCMWNDHVHIEIISFSKQICNRWKNAVTSHHIPNMGMAFSL